MSIKDMLQASQTKVELEETRKERDALKSMLVESGRMELFEIKQAVAQAQEQKAVAERELAEAIAKRTTEMAAGEERLKNQADQAAAKRAKEAAEAEQRLKSLNEQVAAKRKELVFLDDEQLLQSFGFYKPRYALRNSEAYAAKLEQIRAKQADMVKAGTAATCPTTWTVNNSKSEGERMIRDYTKLIVRSFNNECDATIVNVKFNNIESLEKKITKAFETLNNLTKRMSISLTIPYLDLKLDELHLCYEYQLKKQEEKEEQKRIREELREQAKLAKEIEEAKQKIEKEEKHFGRALELVDAQLTKDLPEAERQLLEQEKAKIEAELAKIEKTKEDVLNREQNTRAGYVYVISNIGAFGENVYKIGVTRRLDPTERIDELGDSSVPFDFDIHAMIFSEDAPALENALHKAFDRQKVNMVNPRREFFNVTLPEIERVIKKNFKKLVEITELADAAEYRQSLVVRATNAGQAQAGNGLG